MARSRNLKPGFFKNEELAKLPCGARLLFQGLWTIADREGRLEDRPERIKAEIFPYERHPVDKWLGMLHDSHFILRYENSGRRFIQVVTFTLHQTPHMKEPASTIPAPDSTQCSTQCAHKSSTYIGEGNGVKAMGNGERDRPRTGHFEPPTVDAVSAYCTERKNAVDAQAFIDFYASKGWKVGNQPMRDWQAAVRTWERNQYGKSSASRRTGPGQSHDPDASKKDPNHGRM